MDQKEVMLTQYTPRAAGKAIITGIDTIGIANITLREKLLVFFGSAKKNSTSSVLSRTEGHSVCKSELNKSSRQFQSSRPSDFLCVFSARPLQFLSGTMPSKLVGTRPQIFEGRDESKKQEIEAGSSCQLLLFNLPGYE